MSRYFQSYSSSYSSYNGEVIENTEEAYEIKNNTGSYFKKEFGNVIDMRELEKKEIEKFFNSKGYNITNNILQLANDYLVSNNFKIKDNKITPKDVSRRLNF